MAEEYPDFSIYDKVLEPETKAGPKRKAKRNSTKLKGLKRTVLKRMNGSIQLSKP